ncbi:flagellar biosynthesis anti-sigma factor FlgM [Pistricoccus aurantiacus]|uniref:flagellar biosynthesis anti-sigma factor FlgM n=1 Tax=Pistricoccus aurantiacus TaxID=1883414 RepID=UPI003635AC3A
MKITSNPPLPRSPQAEQVKPTNTTNPGGVVNDSGAASAPRDQASVTRLSQASTNASQDIDTARVAEVRQAISEGRLEIRADKIADGLIDSVRDMLGETDS